MILQHRTKKEVARRGLGGQNILFVLIKDPETGKKRGASGGIRQGKS